MTTKIVAGDILGNVPRDEWPSWEQLLPPGIRAIAGQEDKPDDYGYEGSPMHGATDAASRVAWLDENGIDLESVICLEGMINARFLDDRVARGRGDHRLQHLARRRGRGSHRPAAPRHLSRLPRRRRRRP